MRVVASQEVDHHFQLVKVFSRRLQEAGVSEVLTVCAGAADYLVPLII